MPDTTPPDGSISHSTTDAYLLSADAGIRDAVILGQGLPTEILGQPVKHFWIDGIKTGEYHHRNSAKSGPLKVTRAGMDKWVENFKKMQANGVDVPTITHHLSQDARDSMGKVVDMKRDGDTLKVLHQLIGEDAIRMAARNKISLGISGNYTDGRGINYGEAVIHSALTPVPVVTGLGGFTSLAMRGPTDGPLYELAAPRSSNMPSPEEMAEMRKLPGAESVPEETAVKWLLSEHKKLLDQHAVATANVDTLLSRATEAETLLGEAQGQVTFLSQKVDEAEKAEPTHEAPVILLSAEDAKDRHEIAVDSINLAVDKGDMPPLIGQELKERLSLNGQPATVMLSRSTATANETPWKFVLNLFKGTGLGKLAHRKDPDVLLSQAATNPDANSDKTPKADPKEVAAIRQRYNLPPKE